MLHFHQLKLILLARIFGIHNTQHHIHTYPTLLCCILQEQTHTHTYPTLLCCIFINLNSSSWLASLAYATSLSAFFAAINPAWDRIRAMDNAPNVAPPGRMTFCLLPSLTLTRCGGTRKVCCSAVLLSDSDSSGRCFASVCVCVC